MLNRIELSERQREAVAAAITILATLVILCAVGASLWIVASFLARFSNVFLPLAVAAVGAFVARPYYEWLRRRLHLPAVLAITAVFASGLLPLFLFGWFFGSLVVDQSSELIDAAPETWGKTLDLLRERWPKILAYFEQFDVQTKIRSAVQGQQAAIFEGLQGGLSGMWTVTKRILGGAATLLSWAVLPVYFAFFLMTEPSSVLEVEKLLPFLKEKTRANVAYLVREFVNILVAFFRGQLIIALLQGCLFAFGFSIVGLRYGLVLGLMLGFLNIIPYLGNMVGLAIAIPLALFQPHGGGWPLLLAVLIVFVIVQMIEAYLLTPKIMGDRTGLHPVVIILAIFFWGSALGGIAGMFLAIPLTAFLVVFWRLAKEKYIAEWV